MQSGQDNSNKDDKDKKHNVGGGSSLSIALRLNVTAENLRQRQEVVLATQPPTVVRYIELAHSDVISPPITDTTFPYSTMLSDALKDNGTYRSRIQIKKGRFENYTSFALLELDYTLPENTVIRENGTKVHISLDDEIPGNVANAWNAIVGILQYYNVARTKVVREGTVPIDDLLKPYSQGKQITIYTCLHSDDTNFANLLSSITQALLKNGVEPGYRPDARSSKAVEGNCYLSDRYDWDPNTTPPQPRKASELSGAFPPGIDDRLEEQCRLAGPALQTPHKQVKPSKTNSTEMGIVQTIVSPKPSGS